LKRLGHVLLKRLLEREDLGEVLGLGGEHDDGHIGRRGLFPDVHEAHPAVTRGINSTARPTSIRSRRASRYPSPPSPAPNTCMPSAAGQLVSSRQCPVVVDNQHVDRSLVTARPSCEPTGINFLPDERLREPFVVVVIVPTRLTLQRVRRTDSERFAPRRPDSATAPARPPLALRTLAKPAVHRTTGLLPAPIARIRWPRRSRCRPPANTPGMLVAPSSSVRM